MANSSAFYRACAEQSLRDAEASILANVRELHLHSAAAWQAIAERTDKIEAKRRERQAGEPSAHHLVDHSRSPS